MESSASMGHRELPSTGVWKDYYRNQDTVKSEITSQAIQGYRITHLGLTVINGRVDLAYTWTKVNLLERIFRWIFSSFCCVDSTVKRCETASLAILKTCAPSINPYVAAPVRGKDSKEHHEKLVASKKMLALPKKNEPPKFTPLTEEELESLLKLYPHLPHRMVAQGHLTAYASIKGIHQQGIPFRLGKTSANEELMLQMRYIVQYIYHEKNQEKQLKLVNELVHCLEDCVPVTQGRISAMFQKLTGLGTGFEQQLSTFITSLKDRAFDRTLDELYPQFKEDDYAGKNFGTPGRQQPHVKSGFILEVGNEIGFMPPGAAQDGNANREWAQKDKAEFLTAFHKHFTAAEVAKELLIEINRCGDRLSNEDFLKWWGEAMGKEHAEKWMYKEDVEYPSYSPKPNEQHKGFTQAYINYPTAIEILRKLDYISLRG